MDKWQKVLDIINEVQGTSIEMGEEFDIKDYDCNPYKFTKEGLKDNADFYIGIIDEFINGEIKIIQKPKKWKPKMLGLYFIPFVDVGYYCLWGEYKWVDDSVDNRRLEGNLVCETKEEAIEKAKIMLKAIESEGE